MDNESKRSIETTYSDGRSLGTVNVESSETGPAGVIGSLDTMARSLNSAIGARVDANPELQAVRAERDATPWYRFQRRKKLATLAMKLHEEAFYRQVRHVTDSLEIVDVRSSELDETEDMDR